MATIAWIRKPSLTPNDDYVVAATRGLGIRWWNPMAIAAFSRYAAAVQREIAADDACVAFSLRVAMIPLEGWTISVWSDPSALRDFQRGPAHSAAQLALTDSNRRQFKFAQWRAKGHELPADWNDVNGRFR